MFTCLESASGHLIPSCKQPNMRFQHLFFWQIAPRCTQHALLQLQICLNTCAKNSCIFLQVSSFENFGLKLTWFNSFHFSDLERIEKGLENCLKQNCFCCHDTVRHKYWHKNMLYLYIFERDMEMLSCTFLDVSTKCSTFMYYSLLHLGYLI